MPCTVANASRSVGSVASASVPRFGPEIIRRQVAIGGSIVSPDGEWVVYTRRTVAANRYQSNLWLVPYRGGRPRQLTHGPWEDSAPVFAPDSRTIAFFSDRGEDQEDHLYTMRIDGGEAERICGGRHESMSSAVFSPDGRSIAFVAAAGSPGSWSAIPRSEIVARFVPSTGATTAATLGLPLSPARRPGASERPAPRADHRRLRRRRAGMASVGRARIRRRDRTPIRHRPDRDPPGQRQGRRVRELVKLAGTPRLTGLVTGRRARSRSSASTSRMPPTTPSRSSSSAPPAASCAA